MHVSPQFDPTKNKPYTVGNCTCEPAYREFEVQGKAVRLTMEPAGSAGWFCVVDLPHGTTLSVAERNELEKLVEEIATEHWNRKLLFPWDYRTLSS